MVDNLRSKTLNGVLWSSIERFSSQGIQFVFSIVLARLLSPSDYGIVAMTFIFFAIAQSFIDSGFGNALIRKKNRTQEDMSTCFYFNIGVGILFYILLFLCAPFIADFYKQPILDPVIKVSGLTVLANSLCIVQQVQFSFNIDFKSQAKITLYSTFISGLIGILLAYFGYGVWALVWQGLSGSIIRMLLLWIYSNWRPQRLFSRDSFHYLFGYGSKLLISGLLNTLYDNIYPVVIGKFFSPKDLGLYSRASGYANLPASNVTGIISRVTFPVLSSIQDDNIRLHDDYRRILRILAFIVFPLMTGLAAVASPLIRIMLTSKWDGCILYLQILCFSLMWYPIHALNLNLLQVKGRSDLFLKLEIAKKIVGICIMCVTIPMGITAMCIGSVVSSIIALIINTHYTGILIHLGFVSQMKDIILIFFNSVLMCIIVSYTITLLNGEWPKLIVGILQGVILYLSFAFFLSRKELNECINVLYRK